MLSLWARTRHIRRSFSPKCVVKVVLKKLNIQFGSSSSHGYASLLPENFEMPAIKFEMKKYRNVKPTTFWINLFSKFEYS